MNQIAKIAKVSFLDFELEFEVPEYDHIGKQLLAGKVYERDLLIALYHLVPPGTIMVDIGAYIGTHSCILGKAIGLKIIAIEPNEKAMNLCSKNMLRNDIFVAGQLPVVVTKEDDPRRYGCVTQAGNMGNTEFYPDKYGMYGGVPGSKVVSTIESTASLYNWQVGLLKIDAEQMSIDVLTSMISLLDLWSPVIAIEAQRSQVEGILVPLGYRHYGTYCATPTQIYVP